MSCDGQLESGMTVHARPVTHLDTVSFVLGLEHDLLDSLDPVIPRSFGVGSKSIIALSSANFELGAVQRVARCSILQRNIALGKVWVLTS